MEIKDIKIVIGAAMFLLLFGVLSSYLLSRFPGSSIATDNSWSCTADVKKCLDGTEVGRIPPYCLFAECS